MPSHKLHKEVTEYTWRSLCSLENHEELTFCELDLNNLLNHVCEPDMEPKRDLVQRVYEYCVCISDQGEVEVDIEKCKGIFSYFGDHEKISRCKIRRDMDGSRYAWHHGNGVNFILWRYYLFLAARYYYTGDLCKAARYLARALHYAQDGVVTRYIRVEGVFGEFLVRADELHEIVEDYLDANIDMLRSRLTGVYGIYLELSGEKPFRFKKIEAKEQLDVVSDLIWATVYTLAKFNEIVKWAKREGAKARKIVDVLKALRYTGLALVFTIVGLMVYGTYLNAIINPEVILPLMITAISLIALQGIYVDLKMAELFVLGLVRDTSKLLTNKKKHGTRIIVEKYIPMESN